MQKPLDRAERSGGSWRHCRSLIRSSSHRMSEDLCSTGTNPTILCSSGRDSTTLDRPRHHVDRSRTASLQSVSLLKSLPKWLDLTRLIVAMQTSSHVSQRSPLLRVLQRNIPLRPRPIHKRATSSSTSSLANTLSTMSSQPPSRPGEASLITLIAKPRLRYVERMPPEYHTTDT